MKAAVFHGPRDVRVMDVPNPEAGPDGVLVRVRAAGVCGTDVHTYKTGIFKEMSIPIDGGGALFGHEFSGDVAELGANVQDLKVGDRVVGVTLGAYAEYARVSPEFSGVSMIWKIPDNVSYEEAATIEPLSVSLSTVNRGQPQETDTVLILGMGMIGLGCLQVLRALYPVKQVFVSDTSETRLSMAKEMGADLTIDATKEDVVEKMLELTGSASVLFNTKPTAHVDLVIESAGATVTPQQALRVVRPKTGRVVIVSLYEEPPQIDLNDPVTKNHAIYCVFASEVEDIEQSIELIASGKVNRKPLITHRFTLDDAKDAFEMQTRTSDCFKAIIQP
jgi:2-desacetyl-2-hydroxyethyl bacteriochlorophyllide A dehydrogenase